MLLAEGLGRQHNLVAIKQPVAWGNPACSVSGVERHEAVGLEQSMRSYDEVHQQALRRAAVGAAPTMLIGCEAACGVAPHPLVEIKVHRDAGILKKVRELRRH